MNMSEKLSETIKKLGSYKSVQEEDEILIKFRNENKDLQQKLLQSQASEARLREAILKIEYEYDYTLDKEMTDAVVAGFKLAGATPNTAELEAYVESEIDKRLGEPVAWFVFDGEGYQLAYKQISNLDVQLYAKKG
jgi:hypothetical protein